MTDITDELVGDISAMSDDELLRQINGFDPYDVEFARRFRALTAELAEARAEVERLREGLEAIEQTCDEEIKARCAGVAEEKMKNWRVLSLLQMPRNMACIYLTRAALKGDDT